MKVYIVSFLIDNPPKKGGWERVDEAVEESTNIAVHGDFSDGCTATYDFKNRKEAEELFNKLQLLSTIGSNKKFRISDVDLKSENW